MKTFNSVIKDMEGLIGKKLNSLSGAAAPITITEINEDEKRVILSIDGGDKDSRPFEEFEKIIKVLLKGQFVHVDSILGGSGSSRNRPETILASLPYIEWCKRDGKKCLAYVENETHEIGSLKKMTDDELKSFEEKLQLRQVEQEKQLKESEDNEDRFIIWLSRKTTQDCITYSDKNIIRLCNMIHHACELIHDYPYEFTNLFCYTNEEVILNIIKQIKNLNGYAKLIEHYGESFFDEGINIYLAFIRNEEILPLENKYIKAAYVINNHILETGLKFEKSEDELNALIAEFNAKFSPEKLIEYSDDELMTAMFYTAEQTNDSMCYWLEFNKDIRSQFGSIAGGSSLKYGIYQNKDGEWVTGSPSKVEYVSAEDALELGKQIRDRLVKGAEIIRSSKLETVEDYEKLHDTLIREIGSTVTNGWIHKYFYMIFPDKFVTMHSEDWQRHILRALQIVPSDKSYGRSGQLALVAKYANRMATHLFQAAYDKFGGVKRFIRLGSSDKDGNYADEWKSESIVGIGWPAVGSLEQYCGSGNKITKELLANKMKELYYKDDARTASRKAGELQTFYETDENCIFVVMNGQSLVALADQIGAYYFDTDDANMPNHKPAAWHSCFDESENLPKETEGYQTSCFELKDNDNLMFLYQKYYYDLSEEGEEEVAEVVEYKEPVYHTGIMPEVERNRIVFGAPGTGKSWELKNDSTELLKDTNGTLERVTFHPDYSYAQFVGTYKPVSDARGDIRYEFVAGPLMRVFVEAIKSGRSDAPQPHILLIEEINRAKVAAVFGDVFQLLDRDENSVSEYEIQTSQDVRKHLAKELGGLPEQWDRIKLPDNMFIWSTMNSADQGVFPMDTAFKRRWNFEYIGINDNEDSTPRIVRLGKDEEPIDWNKLRRGINKLLAEKYHVNEDKLMGPYFLSNKITAVDENGEIKNQDKFKAAFESKVLMYLYEDAAKQHKHKLFGEYSATYSGVCEAFREIGIRVFGEDFKSDYYEA